MHIQATKTNRFIGKITVAQDKKACCASLCFEGVL